MWENTQDFLEEWEQTPDTHQTTHNKAVKNRPAAEQKWSMS